MVACVSASLLECQHPESDNVIHTVSLGPSLGPREEIEYNPHFKKKEMDEHTYDLLEAVLTCCLRVITTRYSLSQRCLMSEGGGAMW